MIPVAGRWDSEIAGYHISSTYMVYPTNFGFPFFLSSFPLSPFPQCAQ